ncbi:MAG TPA: nucleotide disphospho-sugar-binding domain-containing protein [Solirubrobacteraceae bacterium]|nr:nucleotide disphospho-sugar-binding domain-containing protein [Solirubrobacteraceae bacterium]
MRLLAYTSPARGHLYPCVPILQELQRRGHAVAVVTLVDELEAVAALGIAAEPISAKVEAIELQDWRGRSQADRGRRALRTFAARAKYETTDLKDAIERHRPDALLVDVNCWGAATVAEASGLPWAMFSPYLLMARSREAPPFGLGLAPMKGPLGRARDTLLGGLRETAVDRTVLPVVNRLRAEHRLPPLRRFGELAERPRQMLAMTAEGFEYPRSGWAANVRFVGPLDWSPPQPRPEWLADLADPLALVTCSTEHQRDRALLATALHALPAAGIGVLGTSAAHDPSAFDVPSGSRVARFLSHDAVLDRAACVVCHGGMGITQKALAAGVPVVVVPFGRDQLDTARRVEWAKAGVRLPAGKLTAPRLAAAVRQALDLRDGAQRVAELFARAGGASAASDCLETMAGTRSAALA